MITKFNLFENINDGKPKVGDYILINSYDKYGSHSKYKGIIGRIYSITDQYWEKTEKNIYYYIKFKMPNGLVFNDSFYLEDLEHWSKNRKDLEFFVDINNFNL